MKLASVILTEEQAKYAIAGLKRLLSDIEAVPINDPAKTNEMAYIKELIEQLEMAAYREIKTDKEAMKVEYEKLYIIEAKTKSGWKILTSVDTEGGFSEVRIRKAPHPRYGYGK